MAKKLKKINHPQRKKNRKKRIKTQVNSVENNSPEMATDSMSKKATQTDAVSFELNTENTKFYTAKETADLLGVKANQITKYIKDERLPNATKVSGKWNIPETDIQSLKKELVQEQ